MFKDVEEFANVVENARRQLTGRPLQLLSSLYHYIRAILWESHGYSWTLTSQPCRNRYILVLCDYATCYPDAVPLKTIDPEYVTEELIQVFARVEEPKEILTR